MIRNVWSVVVLVYLLKFSNGLKVIDKFVNKELYLGRETMYKNVTIKGCLWRGVNDDCFQDVSIILYTNKKREVYDPTDENWLVNSAWDPTKKNVVLIHGYASGDLDPPLIVLKKAYVTHGGYNLFLVDYSKISRPPCYVASVNNVRYIGRCLGYYLNELQRSSLHVEKLICVGHSLGAIICGSLKDYLRFRLHKIIALDPAWPLIFGRKRLSRAAAKVVHVLQTNAGHYGDVGSIGHVNVCVNGGLIQPYCVGTSNPHLCSHIWALCYMSQSLFANLPLTATKCSTYCPNAGIFKFFRNNSSLHRLDKIKVINNVPLTASGTYCLNGDNPPYCPDFLNGFGDDSCCKFL